MLEQRSSILKVNQSANHDRRRSTKKNTRVKIMEEPKTPPPPPKKCRFLLCVDPDSRQVYTYNLETYEVHIELEVPFEYRMKANKELDAIKKVVQIPEAEWSIDSQRAWKYRRRKISDYLLHKMIDNMPTYLVQSSMSDAFSNVSSLKFLIDISEYIRLEDNTKEKFYAKLNPLVLELHIDLVTCVDEVLKKILREVYDIFQVRLKPKKPENQFILQVQGFKEYLSGNYPILNYDRVRMNLRGIQYLQVLLTEVPKVTKIQINFPPIFERTKQDVIQGVYSTVPWEEFIEVPIFYYYAPYPLPRFTQEVSRIDQPIATPPPVNQSSKSRTSFMGQLNDTFSQEAPTPVDRTHRSSLMASHQVSQSFLPAENEITRRSSEILKQQKQFEKGFEQLRPRLFMKEKASEFNEMRLRMVEESIFQVKNDVLYSGECDFPFRLTLVGLSNIYRLLVLDDKDHPELRRLPKKRATYNGIQPPNYLTKASALQTEDHSNSSKKKGEEVEDEFTKALKHKGDQKQLKFCKSNTKGSMDAQKIINEGYFQPHLSHGPQGQNYLKLLTQRYGLDIVPYTISCEVMLMYGQTLLTKFTRKESCKKPFSKYPKWNETINFNNLKVSQLPMETRLSINIYVHSSSGAFQIVGCAHLDIFDDNGKFRQGRNEIHVWPFYKVDNRLACVGDYRGLPIKSTDPDYYCKLIVALDVFECPMYWSLRSHQVMQKLGFYRNPQSREQQPPLQHQPQQESKNGHNAPLAQKPRLNIYSREPEWKQSPSIEEFASLQDILNLNSLDRARITAQDKLILLKCRYHYKSMGRNFSYFLLAIDWSDPEQVSEVYKLMKLWAPLHPNDALPLLDAIFSDELVRLYATQRVGCYKDDELSLFMLEFTQALMFEHQHYSPLGEMLIERALMDPWVVGHDLFWQLKSQLHLQPSYERFALILEQFIMLCGEYRADALKELQVNEELMICARYIQSLGDNKTKLNEMRNHLPGIRAKFDKTFQFAIDPRMSCRDFLIDKCKIMNSKKTPFWLTMSASEIKEEEDYFNPDVRVVQVQEVKNLEKLKLLKKQKVDQENIKINTQVKVMFKCGDDIRQDLLTLQLIKIMDKIWLDSGRDFRMKPYRVISTLDQIGMIEIVLNSKTTSEIHAISGKLGALDDQSILDYLKQNNKHNMENAIDNFLRSCAGYCVATYILGIGDRHSDNIMLTEMGHLFHIDFGHFLGNFKTKLGFKRERTPFVFTKEMAKVMGGVYADKFKTFENYCTWAYNQVRQHGNFLINIFMMMLSAGMPELQVLSDIDYLKEQLSLDLSQQEATEKFKKEIIRSLNDTWRNIDNLIHNIKRG